MKMNISNLDLPSFVGWRRPAQDALLLGRAEHPSGVTLSRQLGDRAIMFLWFILVGYAFLGKGFSYLGFYSIYVGEMALFLGLGAMLISGRIGVSLKSPVMCLLMFWMLWGSLRTLPYIERWGLMALRDGVLWGYVFFTVMVYELMVAKPYRLIYFLQKYAWFVLVGPFVLLISWALVLFAYQSIPEMPFVGHGKYKFLMLKQGDIYVHLIGIIAFGKLFESYARDYGKPWLRGIKRGMSKPWVRILVASLLVALASSGRGGLLAFIVGLSIYTVWRRMTVRLAVVIFVMVAMMGIAAVSEFEVASSERGRQVSVQSMMGRITSMFGSEDAKLELTRQWRLHWWKKIYDYTFGGEHFWGKGFGVNIADADGFQTAADLEGIKLRSPHNVHMNVLARSGVMGIGIWTASHLAWFLTMMISYQIARKHRLYRWTGFFLWIMIYVLACHINGSFDVYIEGPAGGIWFWTLVGIGLVGAHLMRKYPTLLDDYEFEKFTDEMKSEAAK